MKKEQNTWSWAACVPPCKTPAHKRSTHIAAVGVRTHFTKEEEGWELCVWLQWALWKHSVGAQRTFWENHVQNPLQFLDSPSNTLLLDSNHCAVHALFFLTRISNTLLPRNAPFCSHPSGAFGPNDGLWEKRPCVLLWRSGVYHVGSLWGGGATDFILNVQRGISWPTSQPRSPWVGSFAVVAASGGCELPAGLATVSSHLLVLISPIAPTELRKKCVSPQSYSRIDFANPWVWESRCLG